MSSPESTNECGSSKENKSVATSSFPASSSSRICSIDGVSTSSDSSSIKDCRVASTGSSASHAVSSREALDWMSGQGHSDSGSGGMGTMEGVSPLSSSSTSVSYSLSSAFPLKDFTWSKTLSLFSLFTEMVVVSFSSFLRTTDKARDWEATEEQERKGSAPCPTMEGNNRCLLQGGSDVLEGGKEGGWGGSNTDWLAVVDWTVNTVGDTVSLDVMSWDSGSSGEGWTTIVGGRRHGGGNWAALLWRERVPSFDLGARLKRGSSENFVRFWGFRSFILLAGSDL